MCGRTCRWGTSLKESLPGSPGVEHQIEHQMLNPGPLPTQQDRSKNLRAGNSFSGRKMCLGFLGTVEYSEGFNEGNETICGCGGVRTRDMNLPHYPQTIQATKSELRAPPPLSHPLRPALQQGGCTWWERGSFRWGILLQSK